MLKKFFIPASLVSCVLMMTPAFADDSDLNPEAVPGDQEVEQVQAANRAAHQMPDQGSEEMRAGSPQEEAAIETAQAQFEDEQNTLNPGLKTNPEYQNKMKAQNQLEQDLQNLQRDMQAKDQASVAMDRIQIKEDKKLLKQYGANQRPDYEKLEPAGGDQQLRPESRPYQRNDDAPASRQPGGADW